MKQILVIQTAFIGDVVLATPVLEQLHKNYPNVQLDILVRKGHESLFQGHPFVHQVLVWDKQHKLQDWWRLLKLLRATEYDAVVNLQRFFLMGALTAFSKAKQRIGFNKNALSFLFTHRVSHKFGSTIKPIHEVQRNFSLIEHFVERHEGLRPQLYPPSIELPKQPYICIAPASVWFTKRLPITQWIALVDRIPEQYQVLLLGAPSDKKLCQTIIDATSNKNCFNKAGAYKMLESVAVMKDAVLNYVNDSAPLHFASAVNAPVAAVFCSTVPEFGFTPLSNDSYLIEHSNTLDCRPCGLHGKKACPKGHFDCGKIKVEQLLEALELQEVK